MKKNSKKRPRPQRFTDKYFRHGDDAVVLVGALANLYIWSGPREAQTLELPSYPVEQVVQGRDIYQANCAACHSEAYDAVVQPDGKIVVAVSCRGRTALTRA